MVGKVQPRNTRMVGWGSCFDLMLDFSAPYLHAQTGFVVVYDDGLCGDICKDLLQWGTEEMLQRVVFDELQAFLH